MGGHGVPKTLSLWCAPYVKISLAEYTTAIFISELNIFNISMTTPLTPPSTLDLIHMLPLDEAIRTNLLAVYPDKLSFEDKAEVEDTMQMYYQELFDSLYGQHLHELVAQGPLPKDYDVTLNAQVAREIESQMQTTRDNTQIEELRTSLASISPTHD